MDQAIFDMQDTREAAHSRTILDEATYQQLASTGNVKSQRTKVRWARWLYAYFVIAYMKMSRGSLLQFG